MEIDNFEQRKERVIEKVSELLIEYELLADNVNPENWRNCGKHYSQLTEMKREVVRFKEISRENKEQLKTIFDERNN